ncbi:MAG: helix-turn-helix domain-containing protein [Chitinophagales bacterium]|nr:helix-turn-helix domain-containing protein [Chitinophagales bacterium]
MEALLVAREEDLKKWIKEVVLECLQQITLPNQSKTTSDEPLISRKEAASRFNISTNTLTSWVAEGLPHYKNKRRVMFIYSEVLEYIKNKHKTKPSF